MDWSVLLKIGVLVEVTTKDGKTTIGYLDEVGLTQFEKRILVANLPPRSGTFNGRKINIDDIAKIQLSSATKANF